VKDDILSTLSLTPADAPGLPAKARNALVRFLIRWEHYDAAQRCLQQLLVTHGHLVSVYDSLARAHLATDKPDRAVELMRRRHALRTSNTSRALEAQARLAAGDFSAAQAITSELSVEHPDMSLTWRLQLDLRLATGDWDAAEAVLQQQEARRPNLSSTAERFSRLWQARGDPTKALLWARTALARTERDERQPSVELLRLLEELYRSAGQPAQAEATAALLQQRQQRDLEELHRTLGLALPPEEPEPASQPTTLPTAEPADAPVYRFSSGDVISGAVDLTPEERTELDEALRRSFSHDAFRPGQADVTAAVLRGESVLAVMPTGSGKSLCYQLAAQLLSGLTLVISPLIALMKDQVDSLPESIARQATTLNHTLDGSELNARLARAAAGGYRLLYAAPERLRQRPFLHALKRAGVSLLVVDEAHCVSLWGHDFRPDYHFIVKAWWELGQPPILAMTATATPRVRDDIQAALGQMRLVTIDVHRPNLRLEARPFAKKSQKQQALLALCREMQGSGIVYARARRTCEELAEMLCHSGLSAVYYHARIHDRAATQDCFMNDKARIVVATNAFGMGVDKADVRFIIHYDPPKALENYYQEAGRAGRDGLSARCILFHAPGDKALLTRFAREDALHVGFLRDVYAAVERRLGGASLGLVSVGDLERDLGADETDLRVAIHFLETAGLLWRGFDLPRTARLSLCHVPDGDDPDFARFVETARLRHGQTVSRRLLALSQETGLDPRTVEAQVLAWADAGRLRYLGIGRDMLLAVPQAPPDSRQKVAAMLADYRAGQEGRLAEMMAYASTTGCRHGHISAYFGGRPVERCESCDNCLGLTPIRPPSLHQAPKRPKRSGTGELTPAATWVILQGVAELPYPLGRTGLARALQGASTSPIQKARFPMFGTLSIWTQKSIRNLVTQLENEGLLGAFEKGDYRLVRLTPAGQAWLEAHPQAPTPRAPPPTPASGGQRRRAKGLPQADAPTDYDEALFEQLRAWRLETSKEIGKAPYVIFHNKVLQRVAARQPATLEELLAIKGIGPRKLEQYGQAVVAVVTTYRSGQPHEGA
jgi:ATP-dependent DNA helicase RecQ